uniref:Uncharacterized protein n=1 Tax=Geladintestivirus 2 TaxID=3233134 RepID=A0AAU8MI29_9CAUD
MKSNIINKCNACNFEKILTNKNYSFYTKGNYNLNIIGVRSNTDGNKVTNKFDDALVVIYSNKTRDNKKLVYSITTDPGSYSMKNFITRKGTAILVPGQYKGAYAIGKHKGKYTALCQVKPVKVYRDGNKDDVFDFDPATIEEGLFGINIHRSNETWIRTTVDGYSAGCQVFNYPQQFNSFMSICKRAASIWGNSFTYTLLEEKDLDELG